MTPTLAAVPALPLHTAGKYVAGAYIVFLALVLVYVVIMAMRMQRTERELAELNRDVAVRPGDPEREREPVAAGRLTRPPEGEPGWRAEA